MIPRADLGILCQLGDDVTQERITLARMNRTRGIITAASSESESKIVIVQNPKFLRLGRALLGLNAVALARRPRSRFSGMAPTATTRLGTARPASR